MNDLAKPGAAKFSAPSERNRQPILDVLRQVLPGSGLALEVASGTGQHVAHFAANLPGWAWQPSDETSKGFASIAAWCAEAGVANVRPPVELDVTSPQWPSIGGEFTEKFDAVFCANMLHISPWATCAGLMHGAAKYLNPQGLLITYGPCLEQGVATSPGNLEFDENLRQRNPGWGIRHLDDVKEQAVLAGLQLHQRFAMPANNLLLVFAQKQ
jgi:hypothetical protein